jgi:hypothetical protein
VGTPRIEGAEAGCRGRPYAVDITVGRSFWAPFLTGMASFETDRLRVAPWDEDRRNSDMIRALDRDNFKWKAFGFALRKGAKNATI